MAPVDHQGRSGHVAPVGAGHVHDGSADVQLGIAELPERNVRGDAALHLVGRFPRDILRANSSNPGDMASGHIEVTLMPYRPHSAAATRLSVLVASLVMA